MTCEHAKQLLSLKIDGELGAEEGQALERHMAECAACREHERVLGELQDPLALSQKLAKAEARAAESELESRWSAVLAGAEALRSQKGEPEPAAASERGDRGEGLLWNRLLPVAATLAGLALGAWLFLDAFGAPSTSTGRGAGDPAALHGPPVASSPPKQRAPRPSDAPQHPIPTKRRAPRPGLVATAFGGGDAEFFYALGAQGSCGEPPGDSLPSPARTPTRRR